MSNKATTCSRYIQSIAQYLSALRFPPHQQRECNGSKVDYHCKQRDHDYRQNAPYPPVSPALVQSVQQRQSLGGLGTYKIKLCPCADPSPSLTLGSVSISFPSSPVICRTLFTASPSAPDITNQYPVHSLETSPAEASRLPLAFAPKKVLATPLQSYGGIRDLCPSPTQPRPS